MSSWQLTGGSHIKSTGGGVITKQDCGASFSFALVLCGKSTLVNVILGFLSDTGKETGFSSTDGVAFLVLCVLPVVCGG